MELHTRTSLAWFFLLHARRSALEAPSSGSAGSPWPVGVTVGHWLHAGLSGTSIINHFKLEHTSSEREILNGFHVSGAIRTHGRVGTEHQGAHTQLADHLTEEESV